MCTAGATLVSAQQFHIGSRFTGQDTYLLPKYTEYDKTVPSHSDGDIFVWKVIALDLLGDR